MKNLKKTVHLMAIATMTFTLLSGCGSNDVATSVQTDKQESDDKTTITDASNTEIDTEITEDKDLLTGIHHATIEVADYGTITVELDADTAPITVTNFVSLANEGFYDGLTFMRVMENFMIQGGDPNKDCTGGSDTTIKGEFIANNVENNISHVRGTISMARSSVSYDSASSQFFICNADATFLDGEYAAFGTVTEGMEVVDQITTDFASYNGVITDVDAQPVITTITVLD